MTDPATIAAKLTEAQREWILAMPHDPASLTEWEGMPPLFIQFTPDEYCAVTGCYLGGGQRHWFASATSRNNGEGGAWTFTAALTPLGLAVRDILRSKP